MFLCNYSRKNKIGVALLLLITRTLVEEDEEELPLLRGSLSVPLAIIPAVSIPRRLCKLNLSWLRSRIYGCVSVEGPLVAVCEITYSFSCVSRSAGPANL